MAEGSTATRVRRTKAEQRAESLEQILDAARSALAEGLAHQVLAVAGEAWLDVDTPEALRGWLDQG